MCAYVLKLVIIKLQWIFVKIFLKDFKIGIFIKDLCHFISKLLRRSTLLLTHIAFHLLSARSPSPGFQRRAEFEPSTSAVFKSFESMP